MMNKKDWNLLVIAAARGGPLSPTQLQKSLFLLSQNMPPELLGGEFYNFEPYHYGPFNSDVYMDAKDLARTGLVSITPSTGYREYAATSVGLERANDLRRALPEPVVSYVQQIVDWTRSMTFDQLCREIYRLYPEMKAKSIFQY